jgi:hypothetical protein
MEQIKYMDATQTLLTTDQVYSLKTDIVNDICVKIEINKYELEAFKYKVLSPKVQAILCTLTNASYEDIVKVVRDKLNLDDLFDNRHKYLN